MTEFEFAELSAGYALGALSPEDELAYHEALAEHPEWIGLVDSDAAVVADLADGVTEVAPPIELRSRLLAQISRLDAAAPGAAATPTPTDVSADAVALSSGARVVDAAPGDDAAPDDDAATSDDVANGDEYADNAAGAASARATGSPATEQVQAIQRKTWTRSLFALTASIALLIGIGWGVGAMTETLRAPTASSVLTQIERSAGHQSSATALAGGGEATLHWSADVEGAVLVADGLPEVGDDQAYEAWFVRGELPVSVGVFEPTGTRAEMLLEADLQPDDIIALTVEQAGGSPSGQPTSDPLFAIPMA